MNALYKGEVIYRQQAIDIIEDFPHGGVWNVESIEEMVYRIKQLPSAQPERKTGKWIPLISTSDRKRHEWCGYQCSICGERTLRLTQCNFCPNCGSYNGGEQDEID